MLRILKSVTTGTNVSISTSSATPTTICTFTNADSVNAVQGKFYYTLSNLDGAGTYTVTITINGVAVAGSPADLDLGSATSYTMWTDDFICPASGVVNLQLSAPVTSTINVSYIVYDSLPVSKNTTRISGGATNIEEMIVQLWTRFFGKVVLDKDNNKLWTYATNGTTELTEQSVTISGNVETVGEIV